MSAKFFMGISAVLCLIQSTYAVMVNTYDPKDTTVIEIRGYKAGECEQKLAELQGSLTKANKVILNTKACEETTRAGALIRESAEISILK